MKQVSSNKSVKVSSFELVAKRVQIMDPVLVGQMTGSLRRSLDSMRANGASMDEVVELERACVVASFVEREGVVSGLKGQITAASDAVRAIRSRIGAGTTGRSPLYGVEITVIDEFIYWHDYQLKQLSVGEYARVLKRAAGQLGPMMQSRINGALRDAS